MLGQRGSQANNHLTDDLLSAYLDGEVTSRERARAEAHLAECPACAGELRALQATVSLLREMPSAPLPRAFTIPATAARQTRWIAPFSRGWGYRALQGATLLAAVLLMVVCSGDLLFQTVPTLAPAALAPAAVSTPATDQEWLAAQPSPTGARTARQAAEMTAPVPAAPTRPAAPTVRPGTPALTTLAGKATSGTETPILVAGTVQETPTPVPPAPSSPTAVPGTGPRFLTSATPTEETTTDAGTTPGPAPTSATWQATTVTLAYQPSPAPLLESEPALAPTPQLSLIRLAVYGVELALLIVVVGLTIITGAAWLTRRHKIDE